MNLLKKINFGIIFKSIFVTFAIIVFFGQTLTFFFTFDQIVSFLRDYAGVNIRATGFGANVTDPFDALYLQIQDIFYVIAVLSAFFGAIVFSRGRSVLDGIGIFFAFIIPRKRKFSGTVYDVGRSESIAFTSIRVVRKHNNTDTVIATAVTDLDGKYKIYLQEITGSLYVQARASGYQIYEHTLTGLYKNNVIQDIPLKNEVDVESSLKTLYYTLRPRLYGFLVYYLFVLSILSFIFAGVGLLRFGITPPTLLYTTIYGLAVIWNIITIAERIRFRPGKVLDFNKRSPIPSAIISILDEQKQLQAIFSDDHGIVRANLNPGEYKLKASKNGYEMVDNGGKEVNYVEMFIGKDGYLPSDLYMKKVTEDNDVDNNLANPFS